MPFAQAMELVRNEWGTDILKVIRCTETTKMSFKEFLCHCMCCGGNWGGMLLSGINKLYPKVYDAIPDDMGINAFGIICAVLVLLDVNFE